MKTLRAKFRGGFSPRRQGGWIGVAAMVVGSVIKGVGDAKSAHSQQKQAYSDKADLSNLDFQQQSWLAQQQHKWDLENYQMTQNYKEDAIRGFAQYAPPNAASPDGSWGAPPPRTTVDTSGLALTQPNGQAFIIDPKTQQPIASAAPPATLPGVS